MRQKVGPGFGQGEECVATYAGAFRFLTRPIPLMLTRMHRHTRTREICRSWEMHRQPRTSLTCFNS